MITPYLIAASPSAMVAGLFWMISSGRLVTRREADGITKRAEDAEATRDAAMAQVSELLVPARAGLNVLATLEERAK